MAPTQLTRSESRAWWALYGALIGVSPYLQVYAILILLPHAVWIAVRRPSRDRVAIGAVVGLLLASPILIFMASDFDKTGLEWIPRPTLGWLWTDVVQPMTGHSIALASALVLAVAIVSAWAFRKQHLSVAALLIAWGSLPIAVALAFSLLVRPVLDARYVITMVPAWMLLFGVAISLIPWRAASLAVGVIVVVFAARSLEGYYVGYLKREIREAAALVAAQMQPGDAVIEDASVAPVLDYYWRNQPRPTAGTDGARLWVVAPNPVPPAGGWRLQWRQDLYHVSVVLYVPAT